MFQRVFELARISAPFEQGTGSNPREARNNFTKGCVWWEQEQLCLD